MKMMLPVACLLLLLGSQGFALQAGLTSAWFWIPELTSLGCLLVSWGLGQSRISTGVRPTLRVSRNSAGKKRAGLSVWAGFRQAAKP